jgi:iron uptake system EfeUOB component EfeO/EfeM
MELTQTGGQAGGGRSRIAAQAYRQISRKRQLDVSSNSACRRSIADLLRPARVGILRAMPTNFEEAFAAVKELVADFRANENGYCSQTYNEEDARNDFINKFFAALG